ncbi:FmdB family zinc ribbon protein [Halarsenatibacter silvermanii]|nr:FmdB family zinc ribbon protein [Halarsenatibacter silvermanii]
MNLDMPTYLYECNECGRFEKMQGIKEEVLEECPDCGREVRRIIGAPGIVFKGSGFYCTDYGKSSQSPGEPQSKSEDEDSSGSAESSPEEKAS